MTEPGRSKKVYVVEDDAAMRDSLGLMLGLRGYVTELFDSAEAFLDAYRSDWSGCVVMDLRLPGMSGLELQAHVRRTGGRLPFVIITAHGDVASARSAFQAEAIDFLEKPFDEAELRAAIEKGLAEEARRCKAAAEAEEMDGRLRRLTRREREVLGLVGTGHHAKEIAARLNISPRTVEVYKARLMSKLDARNLAELVRFALLVDKNAG